MCSSEGGKGDGSGEGEEDSSSEPTSQHESGDAKPDSPQSPKGLQGKFKHLGGRTTGGGLSAEELQELHKTDPKKVKRILANRSSAARSKVRKLRYIAELDSKSASLHQQAAEMSAELSALQEGTSRLGAENQWLFSQVVELQEQSQRLDQELETLQVHVQQSHAFNRALSSPKLPDSLAFVRESQLPRLPSRPLGRPMLSTQARVPVSAFQTVLQEPRLQGLGVSGQGLGANPSAHQGQAGMLPAYLDYTSALPPIDQVTLNSERSQYAATLQSHNSSEGSGMSSTTQELRLGPEDPALLDLLRSFDLGTPRARDPTLPIPPNSLARYDRSASLNMLAARRRALAHPEEHLQLHVGDLVGTAATPADSRQPFERLGPRAAAAALLPASQSELPALAQGLGRWPRHFSDPQSFHRGPYSGQ